MIELDVSAPWEPPDDPRRPRRRRRALGAVLLLAVGVAVPPAAAPHDLAPLYTVDFQLLSLDAGGGRFVVTRYQQYGANPVLEALDAATGRVLWERPTEQDQSLVGVTDRVVLVQTDRADGEGQYTGRLIAVDAADGSSLWERPQTRIAGLAGGLVLAQEEAWPDEDQRPDESYGDPEDPSIVLPIRPHHERHVALDQRTGREVWRVDSPPGTVVSISLGEYPAVAQFSELDAAGVLRVRDLATGAVAHTYQLGFRGVVASHQAGVDGQEIVWRAGGTGAEVYDVASGRSLWRWSEPGAAYNGPYACLADRYCVFGDSGTQVVDPASGRRLWRTDGYTAMLTGDKQRLLMFRLTGDQFHPDDVSAFDPGTGATLWHQHGWLIAGGYFNWRQAPGSFVWRATSKTDAVVARLDPVDGSIRVIGSAPDFYGSPGCVATGGHVACLAIGTLYVWSLS